MTSLLFRRGESNVDPMCTYNFFNVGRLHSSWQHHCNVELTSFLPMGCYRNVVPHWQSFLLRQNYVLPMRSQVLAYSSRMVIENVDLFPILLPTYVKRQRQSKKKLCLKAVKSKWIWRFKTFTSSQSFDMKKKIWNEEVNQKFCQERSALPFAVPRKREA